MNIPSDRAADAERERMHKDAVLAAMVEIERLGRHYSDGEGIMVLEIRQGRLWTILDAALTAAYVRGRAEMREEAALECEPNKFVAETNWHHRDTARLIQRRIRLIQRRIRALPTDIPTSQEGGDGAR